LTSTHFFALIYANAIENANYATIMTVRDQF